jgi:hypothetical protein
VPLADGPFQHPFFPCALQVQLVVHAAPKWAASQPSQSSPAQNPVVGLRGYGSAPTTHNGQSSLFRGCQPRGGYENLPYFPPFGGKQCDLAVFPSKIRRKPSPKRSFTGPASHDWARQWPLPPGLKPWFRAELLQEPCRVLQLQLDWHSGPNVASVPAEVRGKSDSRWSAFAALGGCRIPRERGRIAAQPSQGATAQSDSVPEQNKRGEMSKFEGEMRSRAVVAVGAAKVEAAGAGDAPPVASFPVAAVAVVHVAEAAARTGRPKVSGETLGAVWPGRERVRVQAALAFARRQPVPAEVAAPSTPSTWSDCVQGYDSNPRGWVG